MSQPLGEVASGAAPTHRELAAASNIHHELGRSGNTRNADGPATALFDFWRQHILKKDGSIANIDGREIEEDNLQSMFIIYCSWLAHNPIPSYWKNVEGIIKPCNENQYGPIECLSRTTITKYVGKNIAWLRWQFPNHPDFQGLDPRDMQAGPEWWKTLKPQLEKGIDDLLQRFDNDFSHGSTATRPLYYKNSFWQCEK